MGVYVEGYFICMQTVKSRRDEGKVDISVIVAVGRDTYRIWMTEDCRERDMDGVKVGDELMVKARPYVSRSGKLSWVSGEIVAK